MQQRVTVYPGLAKNRIALITGCRFCFYYKRENSVSELAEG